MQVGIELKIVFIEELCPLDEQPNGGLELRVVRVEADLDKNVCEFGQNLLILRSLELLQQHFPELEAAEVGHAQFVALEQLLQQPVALHLELPRLQRQTLVSQLEPHAEQFHQERHYQVLHVFLTQLVETQLDDFQHEVGILLLRDEGGKLYQLG